MFITVFIKKNQDLNKKSNLKNKTQLIISKIIKNPNKKLTFIKKKSPKISQHLHKKVTNANHQSEIKYLSRRCFCRWRFEIFLKFWVFIEDSSFRRKWWWRWYEFTDFFWKFLVFMGFSWQFLVKNDKSVNIWKDKELKWKKKDK